MASECMGSFFILVRLIATIVKLSFRLWLSGLHADIVFPWLSTKIHMPEKMSADHETLVALMSKCSTIIKGLKHQDTEEAEAVKELKVSWKPHTACKSFKLLKKFNSKPFFERRWMGGKEAAGPWASTHRALAAQG